MTPNLSGIAQQVDQWYPHLLRQNTSASCFERTARILELANDPRWQHVGKTAGESQFTPAGFQPRTVTGWDGKPYTITGVSADAIVYVPERQVVDTIGNAENDNGSPGMPNWNLVPQEYNRPNNPPIPAFFHAGDTPTPMPQPSVSSFPYPDEATAVLAFEKRVAAAYHAVGRKFPDEQDPDAFRHFARYGYSCSKMAEADAANKHIKELREELHAPPEVL